MNKTKIKKSIAAIVSTAIISAAAVGVCAFSGCKIKTAHPSAQITIEFNSQKYTLDYKLHRDMYPQTVQHFIELADNGFYNNTVIHNYTSSDWFTGGYAYDRDNYTAYSSDAARMAEYFQNFSLEEKYNSLAAGILTPTVFADEARKQPLKTLIGEFEKNQHTIENYPLTAEMGTLKMFYYEKSTTHPIFALYHHNQFARAMYKYNCATSLFAIQTNASSNYSEDQYCVFAELKDEDEREAFDEMLAEIKEYFEDNYGDSTDDYTTKPTVQVDVTESVSEKDTDRAIEQEFTVTKVPIIIKSVKITKY